MNIDTIEKFYKNKFNEDIQYINSKQKIISKIENLEDNIKYDLIEKENYEILKNKRNISLFNNKCKYCEKTIIKQDDRIRFIKNSCCELCFIKNEEGKNGK